MYSTEGNPDVRNALARLLERYLPQSLPLLACLTATPPPDHFTAYSSLRPQSCSQLGLQETENGSTESLLMACCFPAADGSSPPLVRFFCSGEQAGDKTETEQLHINNSVHSFFVEWVPVLFKALGYPERIVVGSLHSRWVPVLLQSDLNIVYNGPCIKVLSRSPSTASYPVLSEAFEITSLAESDLERVSETSTVPRPMEYYVGRLQYSLCVKRHDALVGWGLIHSDGSIGTLFIEPEYRKLGVGKALLVELLSLARRLQGNSALGWVQADIVKSNSRALDWFSGLPSWKTAWETSWIAVCPGRKGHVTEQKDEEPPSN